MFFIIDEKDKKNIPVIDKVTLKKSLKILFILKNEKKIFL